MKKQIDFFLLSLTFISYIHASDNFILTSSDIQENSQLTKLQEYNSFGCNGENLSPQLSWSGAPKETKAFAIRVFDPDAPTEGSGWVHWQLINIPKETTFLAKDTGNVSQNNIPKGSIHLKNDFGTNSFGGPCPPLNDHKHRYKFTVYALSDNLDIPKNASMAVIGFNLNAKTLAKATIETFYKREK